MVFEELGRICQSSLKNPESNTIRHYNRAKKYLPVQKFEPEQLFENNPSDNKFTKPTKGLESKFEGDGPTIEILCERNGYEIIENNTVYCNNAGHGCLYQAKSPRNNGKYRCMHLSKQGAWK